MTPTSATWECPTCSLKTVPYGEACPMWATGCRGMQTPNINGWIYLNRWKQTTEVKSIGIAAISDEGEDKSDEMS